MKIQPFKLERFFSVYEFNAGYLLSSSDCESFSVEELLAFESGAYDGLQKLWLGYTESAGNPELRREISNLYENIYKNEILVHAGAEEAIFTFMNAALKPGDHIIVQFPCYQSLFEIAASIGCRVIRWEMAEENGWELDIDFLESNITANTRAIIINCPNNPTGYLLSREKLEQIVDIARKNRVLLFSDEVYRFMEYEGKDRLPAACDMYENAVSLGVMSKAFGLAGLRIGWIATRNRDIYREMAAFKDYTSICSSGPAEYLSIIALKNRARIIDRNLGIIENNLDLLDELFQRYSHLFRWNRPKAGSIGFPSFKIDIDVEKFCIELVEKKSVLLLPGKYYDYGNRNFRVGFGRKNIPQCVEKLDEYLRERFT